MKWWKRQVISITTYSIPYFNYPFCTDSGHEENKDERKDDFLQMPITFQPEDTGYYVASITVGMFVFCMIEVITICLIYIQMVTSSIVIQIIARVMI